MRGGLGPVHRTEQRSGGSSAAAARESGVPLAPAHHTRTSDARIVWGRFLDLAVASQAVDALENAQDGHSRAQIMQTPPSPLSIDVKLQSYRSY